MFYYLEKNNQIGGNIDKFNEIIDFLLKSDKKTIKKNIYDIIRWTKYCYYNINNGDIIGEGYFGSVYRPKTKRKIKIKIGDNNIKLPIIIKEINKFNMSYVDLEIFDNILYISGVNTLTTEALILIFVNRLWNKTVNLPLLLGYGVCSNTRLINKIITLSHGYKKEFDLYTNINDRILKTQLLDKKFMFNNRLNTLKDLFMYFHYYKKEDDTIILPNKKNCDIIKLFDYFCISFLATYHLLTENNIYISDMNINNAFIHWLNKRSYYNDKNIKNIKEIIYKINNKYYKIETYGILLILGDLGTSIIKIRDDVIILGSFVNLELNYKDIYNLIKPEINNIEFIIKNHRFLTLEQYKKTVAFNILNSKEYSYLPIDIKLLYGYEYSKIKNYKSTLELLSYYAKYEVSEYIQSDYNILIEIKKYNL